MRGLLRAAVDKHGTGGPRAREVWIRRLGRLFLIRRHQGVGVFGIQMLLQVSDAVEHRGPVGVSYVAGAI
jgi:hypothetical protein